MQFYTDGSCNLIKNKGGYACVCIYEDGDQLHLYDSEENTTNNRMEMMGVIIGLETFWYLDKFTIYTDSMYVLNCATGKFKRKLNLDLWARYDKIAKGKDIVFVKVKAHSGIHYNELADKLSNCY